AEPRRVGGDRQLLDLLRGPGVEHESDAVLEAPEAAAAVVLRLPVGRGLAVGRERRRVVVLAAVTLRVVAGHAREVDGPAAPSTAPDPGLAKRRRELRRRAGEGEDGGEDPRQHGEAGEKKDQRPDGR